MLLVITFQFPGSKMEKKVRETNRMTRIVYSNSQIFVYGTQIVRIFAKKRDAFPLLFKNIY